MALIMAQDLIKVYKMGEVQVKALNGIDLQIEEGSFIAFVGPSGSGKTTLLNLIGCLDKPTSGELLVAGLDVSSLDRIKAARFRGENIGFIFQDFNLLPVLTAFENVEYPLLMVQNFPAAERRKRVTNLLEVVGIADQRDKFPDQLSGGQKQRVAIARALVSYPKLVLADEPTANLDHEMAHSILAVMKKMNRELGTSFIFSTHDSRIMGEADIVVSLDDGKLAVNKGMTGGIHA